jgi:hypothetical protein
MAETIARSDLPFFYPRGLANHFADPAARFGIE